MPMGSIQDCTEYRRTGPQDGPVAEIQAIERDTFALIKDYFQGRRTEIAVADIDTATFICVTAVEALTHEFVIRQPAAPSRAEQARIPAAKPLRQRRRNS